MIIAEIHGKISPHRPNGCNERMEDLLTSNVFSIMKYAGWECGFMDWIRSAERIKDMLASNVLEYLFPSDQEIKHIYYSFWPTLNNKREPDLILGIEKTNGTLDMIMIEVKYFSGTSDFYVSDENNIETLSGNQIADQANDFPILFPEIKKYPVLAKIPVESFVHLFITMHYTCPTEIYVEAAKHIQKNNNVNFFWISWHSLAEFLKISSPMDSDNNEMIDDLITLLNKKGFFPFRGITARTEIDFSNYLGDTFWNVKKWWTAAIPNVPGKGNFLKEK